MSTLETLAANLKNAARTQTPAHIGGGEFSPAECAALAESIGELLQPRRLYVIARKNKAGGVDIYKPPEKPGEVAELWVSFDRFRSDKPDYRHKTIILNCYRYPIMWDRG